MRKLLFLLFFALASPAIHAQTLLDSICSGNNQLLLPGDKLTCIYNYLGSNAFNFPEKVVRVLPLTDEFIKENSLENRRGEFYYLKGRYFLSIHFYDSATFYLEKSKELIANNSFEQACNLYRHFAMISRLKGDLKRAQEYLQTGFEFASQLNSLGFTARLLREQGHIYSAMEQYTEALNLYYLAQEKFKEAKDTIHTILIYNDIAEMYSQSGNHPIALDYLDRGMSTFNKINNAEGIACAALIKGKVLERMGNYDKALVNYQIAFARFTEAGIVSKLADVHYQMGMLFQRQKKNDRVAEALNKALQVKIALNDYQEQAKVLLTLGDFYASMQQLTRAHNYYVQSLVKAELVTNDHLILELYQKISDNYYRLGDYKAAIDYKSKSHLIEKQFLVKENYLRISNLELKLAAQINERDNKEKELLGSVYRERTLKKEYLFLAMLFLLLAVIIALYGYFAIRRIKQNYARNTKVKQHKINRQQEYLKNIKEQFDEVNKTISRYFTITTQNVWEPVNSLEKLLLYLNEQKEDSGAPIVPDSIRESLVMSFNLLENLLYWSRHQLDKVEYEPGVNAVPELLHHVCSVQMPRAKSKDVAINFAIQEGLAGYFDSKQIEIAIRNLVENAIKFSTNGSNVTIAAKIEDNRVHITIEDSGVGFTKEQLSRIFAVKKSYTAIGTHGEKGGGIGLAITKLFIEKNFGTLFIESSIAKGTLVTVKLPVSLDSIHVDSRI